MLVRLLVFILLLGLNSQLFANKLLGQLKEVVTDFKDKSFIINSNTGMGILFSTIDNKVYTMQAGMASRAIFNYTHVIVVFDGGKREIALPIENLESRRLTGAKDILKRTLSEKSRYGKDNEYYIFANIAVDESFIKLFFEYAKFSFYFYDDFEKYKSDAFYIYAPQHLSLVNINLIKLLTEDALVF